MITAVVLWLGLAGVVYGADISERVALSAPARSGVFEVVPAGPKGLVAIIERPDGGYIFTGFDTELEQQWQTEFAFDRQLRRFDAAVVGDYLFFGLHRRKDDELTLLRCSLETGEFRRLDLELPYRPVALEKLVIDDGSMYVAGRSTRRGMLLFHRFGEEGVGAFDIGRAEAVQRMVVRPSGGVDVVVQRTRRRHRTLQLMRLDGEDATEGLTLDGGEDQNLLTAQRLRLEGGDSLVVGTFASGARTLGAQGVYVARFDGDEQRFVRFHSFTRFSSFFEHLKQGRQRAIAERAERLAERGRELELDYALLVHDLIVREHDTLLVAEAYYPETITYQVPQTNIVNGMVTTTYVTYRVFLGWRFTHAVVAGISDDGELLWDQSFEIGNVLSPRLERQVRVSEVAGRTTMVYTRAGDVYSKVVEGQTVVDDARETEVVPDRDRVRAEWSTDSAWWFDDTFVVWGRQTVRNLDGKQAMFWLAKARP